MWASSSLLLNETLLLVAVFVDLSLSDSPLVQDPAWFKTVFNKNSNWPTQLSLLTFESKAGRSGESTRLPPMWPGFESWRRRHMWVEFAVGSLPCSERFFSGYSDFPLSSKTNISKFQFNLNARTRFNEFSWTPKCSVGKQITVTNYKFSWKCHFLWQTKFFVIFMITCINRNKLNSRNCRVELIIHADFWTWSARATLHWICRINLLPRNWKYRFTFT